MTQHICPDCKNVFLQPFRCTTCAAQKLYDTTLRQAEQRAERAEADLAAARALLSVRGYAHLGIGAYIINHSAAGEPAELVITPATDEDKATRVIGDDVDNPPDSAPIQPEEMLVRLRFENVAGLDALEKQLAWVRRVHFFDGDITGMAGLLPESGWDSITTALAGKDAP